MVIKIQTADSSHGHNAINYAMNKKADDGRKPEFISSANMPWDNIFGDPIEPRAAMGLYEDETEKLWKEN